MFAYGQLTRGQGIDPRGLTFAVVDVETTGLHPGRGSRICEIGVVRMRGDGVVLDEYSTLVDPKMRIANDEYHGITNADVKGAPTFEQIAGDVLAYLSGAIVVGHNLEFEDKFLTAEFGRLGVNLTGIPGLCTLVMSRMQLDRYVYRLDDVANLVTGEWPRASHSALGDARTLGWTLSKFISEAPQRLAWAGAPPVVLPQYPRTGFIAPRAAGLRKGTEGWLVTLTARLPLMTQSPMPRPQGVTEYQAMLGHALADGRIVGEEAGQLAVLAARAGLTQTTARHVHEQFLASVRARAEADGVVTTVELKELQRAAKELSASHLISDLEEAAGADRAKKNGPLKGWRLLPAGDAPDIVEVMDFAVAHGATVAVNVTKTVRLVVAADAADDPRVAKALATGIRVVTPEQAVETLQTEISAVHGGLFANSEGQALSEQLAAEREEQARAGHPEWHGFWRRRELSPSEYKKQFVDRTDWNSTPRGEPVIHVAVQPQPLSHAQHATKTAAKQGSGCASALVVIGGIGAGLIDVLRQIIA
ncbi:exonuclease domain-containing protein [Streptosporangium minutum]|uniref:DNA polymerase III subunit epsilon n=1 Tax=Streptosporangium minutum TaxID=569862 RepID=A0A243RN18_9ACTN|nr:exonuclease domain-containing protein [Streptosporangium minutum]OUC96339.1 DNA polymerase III subunit epsilon [Streptosporangium minutum]